MNKIIITIILLTTCSYNINAENINFNSGQYQNTVIELYTSEGCSSCPPAENWLNSFITDANLFKKIIPIAFHVDYWNYLGWTDKFADNRYSLRQKEHYLTKNLSQVYTPGVLINGKENRTWRYDNIRHNFNNKVGNLKVDIINNKAYVNFDNNKYAVHIVLLGSNLHTKVLAGENANKKLTHNFVALNYDTKNTLGKRVSIDLPTSNIKDLTDVKLAVAVWVTDIDSLVPIQATASWI